MSTVGIDVSSLSQACNSLAGLCVPLGLAVMPGQTGGSFVDGRIFMGEQGEQGEQSKRISRHTRKIKSTKTNKNTRRK